MYELVYESMHLLLFLTFSVVHRCLPLQLIWFTGEWRRSFTLSARVTCMSWHQTPPLACKLTIYRSFHLVYLLVRSLKHVCLHLLVLMFVRSFFRSLCYVTFVSFGWAVDRLIHRSFVQLACRLFVHSADRSIVLSSVRSVVLSVR